MKGVAEQHRDSPIRFRLVPYRPSGTLENRVRVHADFSRGVSGSEKITERKIDSRNKANERERERDSRN